RREERAAPQAQKSSLSTPRTIVSLMQVRWLTCVMVRPAWRRAAARTPPMLPRHPHCPIAPRPAHGAMAGTQCHCPPRFPDTERSPDAGISPTAGPRAVRPRTTQQDRVQAVVVGGIQDIDQLKQRRVAGVQGGAGWAGHLTEQHPRRGHGWCRARPLHRRIPRGTGRQRPWPGPTCRQCGGAFQCSSCQCSSWPRVRRAQYHAAIALTIGPETMLSDVTCAMARRCEGRCDPDRLGRAWHDAILDSLAQVSAELAELDRIALFSAAVGGLEAKIAVKVTPTGASWTC